ncbi:GNAT family N-acetyltransferase [Paludisphaera rhizosphaerae]|uniref:GNAT family N-acetyltransferase n=1 Tax=Paludisphaera rhizosphaerae TaxID=2711216 RepID=UPI0013EA35B3|nr:GNAT family N-acetyltransferase [Paludisphaera rhizosphaerae]
MLDNPIWASLTTRQSHLGWGNDLARRYPAETAPFLGVRDAAPEASAAIAELADFGEIFYLVGVAPEAPVGWSITPLPPIAQMVFDGSTPPAASDEGVFRLGPADVSEMLALMGAVYPGYFRPRTPEMGLYLGIRDEGRLVAMAGQRMCLEGFREISGVATLPEFRGRGHARRLVSLLVGEILREGLTPFLHVDADNETAKAAYEKSGFAERRDVALFKALREAPEPLG